MILRVLLKLMSRHLLYHLVLPLMFGLLFETLVAWWLNPSNFDVRNHLISKERFVFYGGILFAYVIIALLLVRKEAEPQFDNTVSAELDQALSQATEFFATCTIPLKQWFDPYTQQYFSHIVKHELGPRTFPQERILLFRGRGDIAKAREQYLDGHYAKPLAMIHQNYGIKLGYLRPNEVKEVLRNNKVSHIDFAFIKHPRGETVLLFNKKKEPIKLKRIDNPYEVGPYKALVTRIRARVFDEVGTLRPEHNFLALVS